MLDILGNNYFELSDYKELGWNPSTGVLSIEGEKLYNLGFVYLD